MSSGNVSIFWHCLVSETFIRSSMEFGECGSPAKPPYSVSRSNLLSMMPSLPIFQLFEDDVERLVDLALANNHQELSADGKRNRIKSVVNGPTITVNLCVGVI